MANAITRIVNDSSKIIKAILKYKFTLFSGSPFVLLLYEFSI